MRIISGLALIFCFLAILAAIWVPGVAVQGWVTALIFLAFSTILYGLSDPDMKGTK